METELVVEIESLSNLGSGIAKHNGMVIFVENTCPEDIVKIKLTKQTKHYANGCVIELIKPSKHRVKP
ncbi:MAG: TRAM domain-containing protein, partial [Candidatus Gastranaerophilaceae bacterium]